MINLNLHSEGPKNNTYFTIEKFFNNFSTAFIKPEDVNLKGKFDKEVFDVNEQILSPENQKSMLLKKHIWQIPYNLDLYYEDNETDSSDEEDSDENNTTFVNEMG